MSLNIRCIDFLKKKMIKRGKDLQEENKINIK